MHYQTYLPHPSLSKYIRCYWTLDIMAMPPATYPERIFPDGCTELIFHYGDVFRKQTATRQSDIQPRSFVHGQIKSFIEIEATGRTGMLAVRFTPSGLKAFTPHNVNTVTGEHVPVADFWGKEGDALEDRVLNAATNEQRIRLVERFLLRKLTQVPSPDPLAGLCTAEIIRTNGNVNIDQLADSLHIGRRHLERRVTAHVGLPPKLLARIIRFQHALQLIEQGRSDNLTMVGYESGFYDQAHFIKDFRTFTGLHPRQYFAEDLLLTRHFSFE